MIETTGGLLDTHPLLGISTVVACIVLRHQTNGFLSKVITSFGMIALLAMIMHKQPRGEPGVPGPMGIPGMPGRDGKDAVCTCPEQNISALEIIPPRDNDLEVFRAKLKALSPEQFKAGLKRWSDEFERLNRRN